MAGHLDLLVHQGSLVTPWSWGTYDQQEIDLIEETMDRSHNLVYRVPGVMEEEGKLIDVYQN